ncbi:unnamed protein product [Amoebophrya sp. A25]|nr:unnamed protein product [Amoebophrya sp. A25]|eukprot:GSA25T00027008001.1
MKRSSENPQVESTATKRSRANRRPEAKHIIEMRSSCENPKSTICGIDPEPRLSLRGFDGTLSNSASTASTASASISRSARAVCGMPPSETSRSSNRSTTRLKENVGAFRTPLLCLSSGSSGSSSSSSSTPVVSAGRMPVHGSNGNRGSSTSSGRTSSGFKKNRSEFDNECCSGSSSSSPSSSTFKNKSVFYNDISNTDSTAGFSTMVGSSKSINLNEWSFVSTRSTRAVPCAKELKPPGKNNPIPKKIDRKAEKKIAAAKKRAAWHAKERIRLASNPLMRYQRRTLHELKSVRDIGKAVKGKLLSLQQCEAPHQTNKGMKKKGRIKRVFGAFCAGKRFGEKGQPTATFLFYKMHCAALLQCGLPKATRQPTEEQVEAAARFYAPPALRAGGPGWATGKICPEILQRIAVDLWLLLPHRGGCLLAFERLLMAREFYSCLICLMSSTKPIQLRFRWGLCREEGGQKLLEEDALERVRGICKELRLSNPAERAENEARGMSSGPSFIYGSLPWYLYAVAQIPMVLHNSRPKKLRTFNMRTRCIFLCARAMCWIRVAECRRKRAARSRRIAMKEKLRRIS